MRTENSNDDFYITYPNWKIWVYSILCWVLACIPLLPILLLTGSLLTGERAFTSNYILLVIVCGSLFLLFAVIGILSLKNLNKPIATITRNGFSGLKNFRNQSFAWTPNTVTYDIIVVRSTKTILANLDVTQSRASKLWGGPKAAVVIHHGFAKQKHQDVTEAINRLSPYPIKHITMWDAAKH